MINYTIHCLKNGACYVRKRSIHKCNRYFFPKRSIYFS
uniref:Uncharacterized protein n=1 Tax=Arundo donax TaxID=35708 RepID=A0A0A8XTG8_ARUDO